MIEIFLKSDIYKRIKSAKNVYREIPFSFIDADVLYEGYIDIVIEEPTGFTIIDLKTDQIKSSQINDRALIYQDQLNIYAKALDKSSITSHIEKLLYFARLDQAIYGFKRLTISHLRMNDF